MSSRQDNVAELQHAPTDRPARLTQHPNMVPQDSFLLVSPPGPAYPVKLPPVKESPPRLYQAHHVDVDQPSGRWTTGSPAYLRRRESESSISLGGDAQSHKPSRAPSVSHSQRRTRLSSTRNDGGVISAMETSGQHGDVNPASGGLRAGSMRHDFTEWPTPAPWAAAPAHEAAVGVGPSTSYRPTSEASFHAHRQEHNIHSLRATPQSQLRPPFSPGPVDHWRSPHARHSPYTGLATRTQPPLPAARFQPTTSGQLPTPQIPLAGMNELPVALERIQTSLTALHERINSIEYTQTTGLRQPANSWRPILRALGIYSSRPVQHHRDGYHHSTQHPGATPQSGLMTRAIVRLLGTVRRAVIDATFMLVVMSLFVAVSAGIRGRGRGGRRALLQFWMTAMQRTRAVGRSLRGELGG
jgi:hypothetical protein